MRRPELAGGHAGPLHFDASQYERGIKFEGSGSGF